MFPFITVFGYPLPTYWLFALAGIGAAGLYVYRTNRGKACGHLPGADVLHLGILGVVGAVAGGKLLYVVVMLPLVVQNWAALWANPALLVQVLLGGLVFYGGLYGALLAGFLYCRRYGLSYKTAAAVFTPAIPLFHTFGRIGCFFGGCCWGVESSFGIAFTRSIAAPNGVLLFPIQLAEAFCNLLLFVLTAAAVRKMAHKWLVLPLYLFLYACLRFTLEFWRGDRIRGIFIFSTSQWVALATAAVVAVLFFARWRRLVFPAKNEGGPGA
ncbi:MAG: prolipoprotein diacylglyceryl transferase [Oscillospiraceae bacterium]